MTRAACALPPLPPLRSASRRHARGAAQSRPAMPRAAMAIKSAVRASRRRGALDADVTRRLRRSRSLQSLGARAVVAKLLTGLLVVPGVGLPTNAELGRTTLWIGCRVIQTGVVSVGASAGVSGRERGGDKTTVCSKSGARGLSRQLHRG